MIMDNLKETIERLEKRFDEICVERKELLTLFAAHISEKVKENKDVNLNFICTHNSRRSHMSQIWAHTAAEYYGIPNVNCSSCLFLKKLYFWGFSFHSSVIYSSLPGATILNRCWLFCDESITQTFFVFCSFPC